MRCLLAWPGVAAGIVAVSSFRGFCCMAGAVVCHDVWGVLSKDVVECVCGCRASIGTFGVGCRPGCCGAFGSVVSVRARIAIL